MGPLLVGGEGEHRLDHMQVLPLGQSGGKGVAVAGLALSRKGAQQVLMGLTLGKVDGHVRSLPFHGCL